ncbi:MAG: putative ABC exporter domain-containing protein [Gemmatimonadales bacterium]
MIGALAFLISRTLQNRIVRQAERIRSPRYALAMIAGIAYFWFFFFRRAVAGPGSGAGDSAAAAEIARSIGSTLGNFGSVALLGGAAWWWLKGGVSGALAFQPAEVQFLFAAPLSRRALLGYKIVRGQFPLIVSALIWLVLMNRWGLTLSAPMRFATAWGFFTVIGLHRLAAALVQTQPVTGGRRFALNAARLLAAGLAAVLLAGVVPALRQGGAAGLQAHALAAYHALDVPPAAWALAPFRVVLAPLSATGLPAWIRAFAIVAGFIVLHLAWILSMDVAFEEAAVAATTARAGRLAAFRKARSGGAAVTGATKVKRDWLPLASGGRPETAIVWKNTLALVRTGGLRAALFLAVMLGLLSSGITSLGGGGSGAAVIPAGAFVVMTLVMGPRVLRNDLRQDLLSLSLLKSYPLRGERLVAAELVSPALTLTVLQYAIVVMAVGWLPLGLRERSGDTLLLALVTLAPFALGTLNATSLAIQNGAALMFPAWVRLGSDSGGIEAIGQNLLFVAGTLLALALALVPPLIAGGAALAGARFLPAHLSVAVALGAGTVVLAGEVTWMVRRLGLVFERTESSALL